MIDVKPRCKHRVHITIEPYTKYIEIDNHKFIVTQLVKIKKSLWKHLANTLKATHTKNKEV